MAEVMNEQNPEEETKVIEPEVDTTGWFKQNTEGKFPSPFGGTIGFSSVDLTDETNEKQMLEEYDQWQTSDEENKDILRENWHQKYYGMSFKDAWHKKQDQRFGAKVLETAALPGMALADFAMDAMGTVIPKFDKLDDRWDQATKYDDHETLLNADFANGLRSILSIVLPSMMGGGLVAQGTKSLPAAMPAFTKGLVRTGAFGAQNMATIGLSDVGEHENITGTLSQSFPGIFGPEGWLPIPEWLAVKESDSPSVRKWKNILEEGGLSVFGSTLGAFLAVTNKIGPLDFFWPLNKKAEKYKQLELLKFSEIAEADKLIKIQKIDELLSTNKISNPNRKTLLQEKRNIIKSFGKIKNPDDYIKRDLDSRVKEAEATRLQRLQELDPDVNQLELPFDPDLNPGWLDESGEARQTIPPANVARNMADTSALKKGDIDPSGNPAPLISNSMLSKGLGIGSTSRKVVMGISEHARDIGPFDGIVDTMRQSPKDIERTAWEIYTSIMAPGSTLEDIKKLFLERSYYGKVAYATREQALAAKLALRDLTDRFLGREITESSARVMDTLGREVATMSEGIKIAKPYVDEYRAMDLIIDKMQFLMNEHGLNKYIAGFQLQEQNQFLNITTGKEFNQVIKELSDQFIAAENALHAKNQIFTDELRKLKVDKPQALKPLIEVFGHTDGDVDTLAKLYKWTEQQVTWTGMLKSPNPKELNLFAKGLWSVKYNNILSGKSAINATKANTYQLILKPFTAILGHAVGGDINAIRQTLYYHGAVQETQRRAITDAFKMMKKVHKDPDLMLKAYRKDFVFEGNKTWGIVDKMQSVYRQDKDWGNWYQIEQARRLTELGQWAPMRYGMTGLSMADAYTSTNMAHYLSRMRAYDEVFSELGQFNKKAIEIAEAKHYATMFDENGLIRDKVLKQITGEINLNLDDGLATYLNQATTAYPILKEAIMFPRTQSNWLKNSLSWTPLGAIPGVGKYGKTIWASTDEEIAIALAAHGLDFNTTPHARALFKQLKAEYKGRVIFGTTMTSLLYNYAMSGNITGSGHHNASRRYKEINEMGFKPKHIKIGGKWVPYEGIPGISQLLSVVGNIAYYRKDLDSGFMDELGSKIGWTITSAFLQDNPVASLEPLVAIVNNDLSGWNRMAANSIMSSPIVGTLSGGGRVVASAIDNAQKEIDRSIISYLKKKNPFFNHTLPDKVDIWTGEAINDIKNPWLRVFNALGLWQVSDGNEPWREWLYEIGYDGVAMIKMDSSGSYEYTPDERELINKFIGAQNMAEEVKPLMKNKIFKQEVEDIKQLRRTNPRMSPQDLEIKIAKMPLYRKLNSIVRTAQRNAEAEVQRLAREQPEKYGHIPKRILYQQLTDTAIKQGNIPRAVELNEQYKKELIQYGNN